MDLRSRNQVNAIRTTITLCDGSTAITSPIKAFAPVLLTVKNKVILIDQYDQIVQNGTRGVTLDTIALRKVMTDLGFKCANAVYPYAISVGNLTLATKVNHTISYFDRLAKEEISVFCQTIYTAANDNILTVVNYGITATDVSDLLSAITLYNLSIQNPRQATVAKSNAVIQIKLLIRNILDVQFHDFMDRMVNTLLSAQSEFVRRYFKAREIIDLGKIHTKIKGTTKDSLAVAIPATTIKLMKTGTTLVDYLIKATSTGKIPITYVRPDDYDILVEHADYVSIFEPFVHFAPGKTIKRDYVLIHV